MTTYAMDTNIVSYVLRNDTEVINNYRQESSNGHEFVMLPVVYYEITRWLLERNALKIQAAFTEMCADIPMAEITREVWDKAAALYAYTRRIGKPINDADLLIAASCVMNDYTLVTNNVRHFQDIAALKLTNWKY